jgi:hypothetical protein
MFLIFAQNLCNVTISQTYYKRYQKRKTNTTYNELYGSNVDEKYKYNNIFKYKEFDKVKKIKILIIYYISHS